MPASIENDSGREFGVVESDVKISGFVTDFTKQMMSKPIRNHFQQSNIDRQGVYVPKAG